MVKKRILIFALAWIWILASCLPSAALASEAPTGIELVFNHGLAMQLDTDNDGTALIGRPQYGIMAGQYVEMLQVGVAENVRARLGQRYLSMLGFRIESLSDFQSEWHNARSGQLMNNVPITLHGAKASAYFDSDAQNAVRKYASLPAASQLVKWLFRSALAASTGRSYPSTSINLNVAIQDWSELSSSDLTAKQQQTIAQYNCYGGVRATVSMAIGNQAASQLGGLGRGRMVLETTLSAAPAQGTALMALRVDENGGIQSYPVTVKGTRVSVSTNQFGDYIFVAGTVAPTTGDGQPVELWLTLMGVSALFLLLAKRRTA